MRCALLLIALLAPGCPPSDVVRPEPQPAPVVDPDPPAPPAPTPDPADTRRPCERAAARAVELGCGLDADTFAKACERYEEEATTSPAMSWNPECQAAAVSCAAIEFCRGVR